jgi:hypothetical protein
MTDDLEDDFLSQFGGDGEGPAGYGSLADLSGRQMYDPNTGYAGSVFGRRNTSGGATVWFLVGSTGQPQRITRGGMLIDPVTRLAHTIGDGIIENGSLTGYRTSSTKLSENDVKRLFGVDGGGGASEYHPYSGTRESQTQSEQAAAAERERDRAAAAELDRIREENANRRAAMGEAGSSLRDLIAAQDAAKQRIADLTGRDPVGAAVHLGGGVQRGVTPAEAFRANEQQFANQPAPAYDPNTATTAELQAISAGIRDRLQEVPSFPGRTAIGMAGGGMMGGGGSPRGEGMHFGTSKTAVLVGEGEINGDEEVVVHDPATGTTEVIPLSGGAQGGATIYDPDTIRQALQRVYGNLGFTGSGPSITRGPLGNFSFNQSGPDTVRRLGYRPRLFRDTGTGSAYFRDDSGMLRYIASPDVFTKSGFDEKDLMNVSTGELGQFGQMGGALNAPPPLIEGNPRQAYPTPATPLFTPPEAGSIPLPDPRMLAGIWRFLDPATQDVVFSSYDRAGLGEQARQVIENTVRFFSPTGTATGRTAAFG